MLKVEAALVEFGIGEELGPEVWADANCRLGVLIRKTSVMKSAEAKRTFFLDMFLSNFFNS